MPELDRTAQTALKIVLDVRAAEVGRLDDRTRQIVTEALLGEIFQQAWRHQFDEERLPARKSIREIVTDAIEAAELGENR